MGRKKRSSAAVPPPSDEAQAEHDGAVALAEQLLAEMGLESESPRPPANALNDAVAGETASATVTEGSTSDHSGVKGEEARPKRRNRRKEKLAERDAQYAAMAEQVRAELADQPDTRKEEMVGIARQAVKDNLSEKEVDPDGHCLFSSISDQLQQRKGTTFGAQELRELAAKYIEQHPDDFVPFMLDESTGELRDLNEYTESLRDTAMWGGDVEIMALSRVFHSPIKVYFGSQPPLTVNEDETGEPLRLAYYTRKYGLGAHYNSLRDAEKV